MLVASSRRFHFFLVFSAISRPALLPPMNCDGPGLADRMIGDLMEKSNAFTITANLVGLPTPGSYHASP